MGEKVLCSIPVPRPFHLGTMVLSHGWVDLEPFRWDRERKALEAVIRTGASKAFALRIASEGNNRPGQRLVVEKLAGPRPAARDRAVLEAKVRRCFRLDEDFTPFQARCRTTPGLEWVADYGLGPFLRNPDLFEEFAKMLLTTNISWAGTKLLNRLLLEHLGDPVGSRRRDRAPFRAFPTAQAVARRSERFLREKLRVGYRAPFLKDLARRFARGDVKEGMLFDPARSTEDLAKFLSSLHGFGPYAVNSLLITLGRYEHLILDSWTRKTVARIHFRGGPVSDRMLREHYAPWGPWAGLALWFECAYHTWFRDELEGRGRGVVVGAG